ncbi:putative cytochrome P450 monooxygenase [Entomophthora muscae]|uniref:Cytochrome P450 monooxygenase n=1 Tax=Entomophthora muscae TaxID=34485 RepID=A0ACC2SMQ5_9FUNG|nr:putative cytochrome P450 monooxygenase [Entomophthora muscae]
MLTWVLALILFLWWAWQVFYSVVRSPLRHVPSPWVFQLFPAYFYLSLAVGDSPQFLHYYFLRYGSAFRVGWDVVMFVDGDAASSLYSSYQLKKSKDYSIFSIFGPNMLTIRDRVDHAVRRRRVGPAMTKQSIAKMEPVIIECALKPLIDNIDKAAKSNEPINLHNQFHCYAWDIIGRLAFGESFNMLNSGSHPVVGWVKRVLEEAMLSLIIPFYGRFKSKEWELLTQFTSDLVDGYVKRGSFDDTDIIGHFLAAKENSPALTRDEVFAESFIQLAAGTDTSSNTTNWLFYNILTHPHVEDKLIAELSDAKLLTPGRILTLQDITDRLPYFEMCLKETMRILPAISSAPFRIIPKGGKTVLGYHLPEGTKVAVPIYSLHRSPAIWENPDSFIPERWQSLKLGPCDYLPFLMGPRACAGK